MFTNLLVLYYHSYLQNSNEKFYYNLYKFHKNYYVPLCYSTRGMRLLQRFSYFSLLMGSNEEFSNKEIFFSTYLMASACWQWERSHDQMRKKTQMRDVTTRFLSLPIKSYGPKCLKSSYETFPRFVNTHSNINKMYSLGTIGI